MSRIVKCELCGFTAESFRPSRRQCNHNQDEIGVPIPLAQMFPVDPKTEAYVKAWIEYHLTAEKIDNNIKPPFSAEDYALIGAAMRAGTKAQVDYLHRLGLEVPFEGPDRILWNRANDTALRILGLERE